MKSIGGTDASMRHRLTAVATLVVAIVLAASACGLIILQRSQLTANLDHSLEQRADAFIATLTDVEPGGVIANSNDEDRGAQLVAADGTVIAATPNLAGAPALTNPLRAGDQQVIRTSRDLQIEDDAYRVLTRRFELGRPDVDPVVLHIAENSDDLNDAIRGLTIALAIAVPIVVMVLGALIWWLVGRTLRPVEAIRSEVAAISGTDLTRRVPVSSHHDEITRLATTMNEMLDRIAASAEQQRRFAADASHELRTPITRIRTQVEVDMSRPEDADPAATYALVLEETIALQRLIDDLLYLARSDANADRHDPRPTDLDDVVLREVRRRTADSTIRLDVSGVSAAHLLGDPDQLTRVVRNLLTNALRHASTTVTLTLSERAGTITFTVADDGPGVPIGARERIFERFARVDDARMRTDGGTGLGLAIVRDIVERHGGTVSYDSERTDGARFIAVLPAAG